MIRQYCSPRRQEKWSSSHLGQAGGGCLLTWGWLEGGCFHLCLGVMKECSLFILFHHCHKASSSDTDVLGNCVCSGRTGTAWPGARGQLLAVVQQACFFLSHPLLQTLFSSGGSGLEGKSPALNLPGGKEARSLLPAYVREEGMSTGRKQEFICRHVFLASWAWGGGVSAESNQGPHGRYGAPHFIEPKLREGKCML